MKNRHPFTLIELPAMIAIIAILAGMLLPILKKTRKQARKTAIMNNFHGTAVMQYINDNNIRLIEPFVCKLEISALSLYSGNAADRPGDGRPELCQQDISVVQDGKAKVMRLFSNNTRVTAIGFAKALTDFLSATECIAWRRSNATCTKLLIRVTSVKSELLVGGDRLWLDSQGKYLKYAFAPPS